MKIMVTGVAGQLGHDVVNELASRGHEAVGTDLAAAYAGVADGSAVTRAPYVSLDITDREATLRAVREARPDAVIHCAAWTAVDAAEDEDKRARVFAVNADGTRHIAEACAQNGCKCLYISTDYVFDGAGEEPWQPDCRDFGPKSVYGASKLAGERAVEELVPRRFIVRIAWAFGLNGQNFIKTMLRLGATHEQVRVVCDQIGTPTYTLDLARLLADMIESERYGVYHATNEGGFISWAEFAQAIFEEAGLPTRVVPVTTAEYGLSKAERPFNSRLDKRKLAQNGFAPLPDWRDALRRYLKELGAQNA